MIPVKPMKAIDIKPAVINAIGKPRSESGIPSLVSMRSRIPAINEIASRKPNDEPRAFTSAAARP